MARELVLDASVSLAWFLKETPERAVYAAAVSAVAAEGAILHVPVQWGMEMGHVLLREHRRKALSRRRLEQAIEDLDSFDIRVHLDFFTTRAAWWNLRDAITCRATMPCTSNWRGPSSSLSPPSITATDRRPKCTT